VLSVEINYATRRARVRWDNSRIQLSAILKAVSDIGYIAHPFDPGRSDDLHRRERNTAIKRLAIAGLGMMQVMMYALPTYTATDMTDDIRLLMSWASLVSRFRSCCIRPGPSSSAPGATSSGACWGWTCRSRSASAPRSSPASTAPSRATARCTTTRSRCSSFCC
jgi:hypothetical protein